MIEMIRIYFEFLVCTKLTFDNFVACLDFSTVQTELKG